MDGLSLTIGGSLGGAIVAGIVKIWTSVNQKTKIEPNPNPFPIQRVNECISVQECNRKMCEMEARICKLETNMANGFNGLMHKLDAMDQKSEDRSVALHRRVDTISERTATTAGEVGMIKDKMFAKRK